jgi:hypothetical protein
MTWNLSSFSFALLIPAMMFVGCSKENPVINKQVTGTTKNANLSPVSNPAKSIPGNFGAISGRLYPIPDKAVVIALNDHYVSDEAMMNPTGTFTIQNLPPDSYYLFIRYVPVNYPDYLTFKVDKVSVQAGQETVVGQINLPG